jgi:putative membrane protein
VLAGFDYPFDPIGASVQGMWTYKYPSGQFGVPLTNYLGWIFTGWVLFQIFALAEHRFRAVAASTLRSYWLLPCLIWIAMALQYPIFWAAAVGGTVTQGGRVFMIVDIYEASVAGSLFTLVLIGMIGVVRLFQSSASWSSDQR